jgi:hypothetical protein
MSEAGIYLRVKSAMTRGRAHVLRRSTARYARTRAGKGEGFMSRRSLRPLGRFAPKLNCEQLESRLLFAAADLSDWTGSNNTVSPNNYTTSGLPSVTAGGTFQARRGSTAASLSDPTIGTALGYNTSFSMSGSITFNAPTSPQIDPVWFLGFYNNTTNTHRVGLSAANATPAAGDALRFQIQSTAAAGTSVVNADLANGGNENIADGTYAFSLTYNGTTHSISASIGSFTASATYAYTGTADLNRFGFLQPANTADTSTFTASITNINYTGETQVSGSLPAAPTALSAAPGNGQVTLNWTDNASNETGFKIQRATNSAFTTGVVNSTAAANATSAPVTGLTNGTTYWFRVAATNGTGDSAWSNVVSAVPTAQATPIYSHGNSGYSSTYAASWTGLQTGKQIIQGRPPTSVTLYNVRDGIIDGNNDGDYTDAGIDVNKKDQYTSFDAGTNTATLANVNYNLTWTATQSEVGDAPRLGKMWHFENFDKFIVDNVTINQVGTVYGVNTISFYNIDTVEIRNSKFAGETRLAHLRFQNVKKIFIDGIEVTGNASGYGGAGISVQNGDSSTPLGTHEWLVVQNSYFHDVRLAHAGDNRDGILIHTFRDGMIFNNTFENWVSSSVSGNSGIDAAVDVGLRAAHPSNVTALLRIERNQFINDTLVKSEGNPGADAVVRHNLLWTNNEFLNTGPVDYHYNYTLNYVNNTHVFDDAKKGPYLGTVQPFHSYWAFGEPSYVNVYNSVVNHQGSASFILYQQKAKSNGVAQTKHNDLESNHNWIGITATTQYWMQHLGTGGTQSLTYTHWSGRGFDVNTKVGAVSFANYASNNFRLSGPPSGYTPYTGYNAGGPLVVGLQIFRDFDGKTRGSSPTVGAYQLP